MTRSRITAARALALAAGLCFAAAAPALGAQVWRIDSLANTTVAPGGTLDYIVQATNVGDASMDGSEIDVRARLPPGMAAVSASLYDVASNHTYSCFDGDDGVTPVAGVSSIVCSNRESVPWLGASTSNFQKLSLRVSIDHGVAGRLTAEFSVSGGGASAASTVDPTLVSTDLPSFGIDAFDGLVRDAAGDPFRQAGGHPDGMSVSLDFNTLTNPNPLYGTLWPVEGSKDIVTDLAPGLVGDPTAVDQCTLPQLANSVAGYGARPLCPPTSQVGTALVRVKGDSLTNNLVGPLPLFNLVPPPAVPARFGFNVLGSIVTLDGRLRSGGDYGISVDVPNVPQALAIVGTTVDFWGVPAAPSHDAERACAGERAPSDKGPTCRSGAPLRPFFRYPTSCGDPDTGLPFVAHIDSWQHPGVFRDASWATHEPPAYPAPPEDWGVQVGVTGCDKVPFDPTFTATPQPARAGEPAAFSFDLSLPQSDDPDSIAQSDLRTAKVTLPAGVRVAPGSASGLQSCSPAQIALRSASEPSCPDGSKLGSVTIDTPLLDTPLDGAIYLATPFDNPSHSLISIYLVASGQGIVVKLDGEVRLDPATGQITATFDDNPQTPFSKLHLEFDGGPRAALALPDRCGTYTTHAVLTGWNGRTVASDSSFTLRQNGAGQPCPSTFTPAFEAGTASNSAGSSSSFLLRLTRDDADQRLEGLTVTLPPGVTGRPADVPACGDADARAGTCPEATRVGSVTVGAGAGPNPFYISTGRAYWTGPYKGAPFGVSIVVPAVAGPFDLGDVVVRAAVFVDKHDASVRIVSDPLPTILQGIPLDVRDVRVTIDRPGFFLNPTSCAPKTVGATVTSTEGASARVSTRFQAADCASLAFKPRMAMIVGGRRHTARGRTTPLRVKLTMPPGGANLRYVRAVLPTTLNARLTTIQDACTRAEFETDIAKCAHAKAGTATAVTPLLAHALRGSVYFVKNGHPIPDLFVALRGQVDFDLIGRVTIPGSKHLATTFKAAPDVPIRSFALRLYGDARRGSVGNATSLCSARARRAKARLDYIAQSGKVHQVSQQLRVKGCRRHMRARRKRSST